jgi:hypothetical protein
MMLNFFLGILISYVLACFKFGARVYISTFWTNSTSFFKENTDVLKQVGVVQERYFIYVCNLSIHFFCQMNVKQNAWNC